MTLIYVPEFKLWAEDLLSRDKDAHTHILAFVAALEWAVEQRVGSAALAEDAVMGFLMTETFAFKTRIALLKEPVLLVMLTQYTDATVFDMITDRFGERVLKIRTQRERKQFVKHVLDLFLLYLDASI